MSYLIDVKDACFFLSRAIQKLTDDAHNLKLIMTDIKRAELIIEHMHVEQDSD
jgi:hypothetical protein